LFVCFVLSFSFFKNLEARDAFAELLEDVAEFVGRDVSVSILIKLTGKKKRGERSSKSERAHRGNRPFHLAFDA
jgi:hypothetical protein